MTLVAMAKDGVTLDVHPSCVAAHASAGWTLAPEASEPPAPDTTVGKGPRGRWYVKRGKEIVAGPFATEAEAKDHE